MKKALRGCARLSLVDYTIEISNLDLVKDFAKVIGCFSTQSPPDALGPG
jgi:hypothetical protein